MNAKTLEALEDAFEPLCRGFGQGDMPRAIAREFAKTAVETLASSTARSPVEGLTPEDAWQDLLDKDDRNSPAEYPEMALITLDELRAYMAAALTAIHPQAEGETGWRPIETAPRDGTRILAAIATNGAMFSVHWEEEGGNGSGWVDGATDAYEDLITYHPTHWRPLPAPPHPEPGEL